MSVRVNLLPEATKQRDQQTRQRALAGLASVLLLLVLGGVYLWSAGEVRSAEDELAAEQDRTAQLRAEQAELVAFRDLATRSETAEETLIAALAGEVSLAGLLQDLAAVLPEDAQMDTLGLTITPSAEPGEGQGVRAGSMTISGRTLTAHAPGVERVLLSLDKIATLDDLFMTSSTLDEETTEGVAAFTVDGQIRIDARTERYAEGLPEALR